MSGLCNHEAQAPAPALDGMLERLDPRAKVVALLGVTLVAVSGDWDDHLLHGASLAVLIALAALGRVRPTVLWRSLRPMLLLVLPVAALAPLTRGAAGWHTLVEVASEATIGTLSAALLAATTPYAEVLRALAALRVPRTLVLIASLMHRYLLVIGDEVRRMRAARDARGYRPRTLLGAGATGRLVGSLFLRSHARGERVYLAMLARGYDGTLPVASPLRLARVDVAFVAALGLLLVPLRLLALGAP